LAIGAVQDYGYFLGVEDDNKWAKKRHLIQVTKKIVFEYMPSNSIET
jgi:hypothetical protein